MRSTLRCGSVRGLLPPCLFSPSLSILLFPSQFLISYLLFTPFPPNNIYPHNTTTPKPQPQPQLNSNSNPSPNPNPRPASPPPKWCDCNASAKSQQPSRRSRSRSMTWIWKWSRTGSRNCSKAVAAMGVTTGRREGSSAKCRFSRRCMCAPLLPPTPSAGVPGTTLAARGTSDDTEGKG